MPRATPFRKWIPSRSNTIINTIRRFSTKYPKTYQHGMGNLNWLCISMRLDITTKSLILSVYNHKSSRQRISSAQHVIKYCSNNPSWGLFSHRNNPPAYKNLSCSQYLALSQGTQMRIGGQWMHWSPKSTMITKDLCNGPNALPPKRWNWLI